MTRASPIAIAITGHRPNRLHVGIAETERRIRWVLAALRKGARTAGGGRPVAISALAEGSDRMFASAALDLGFTLHALLPFPSAHYEKTFGDAATTNIYRELLARAASITELPGTLADTKSAYEAVGRATVEAADILVSVWDGEPAAGRGGTPEIIEYALARRTPVIWIDAARLRLPRLFAAPTAPGAPDVSLTRLAGRARPLTRRRIEALAASISRQP